MCLLLEELVIQMISLHLSWLKVGKYVGFGRLPRIVQQYEINIGYPLVINA